MNPLLLGKKSALRAGGYELNSLVTSELVPFFSSYVLFLSLNVYIMPKAHNKLELLERFIRAEIAH